MTTIAERVAAGAAWLDENRPGWVQRIDLNTLDLGDPCRCVLGQEYGDFNDGPDDLVGFPGEKAVELGFDENQVWSLAEGDQIDLAPRHAELTAAWRELILARRAEVSA